MSYKNDKVKTKKYFENDFWKPKYTKHNAPKRYITKQELDKQRNLQMEFNRNLCDFILGEPQEETQRKFKEWVDKL